MATSYHWICGCGSEGRGEAGAQRHSKECGQMGWPWCNPDYPRPPEQTARARRYVAGMAADVEDAKVLLAMLGLEAS